MNKLQIVHFFAKKHSILYTSLEYFQDTTEMEHKHILQFLCSALTSFRNLHSSKFVHLFKRSVQIWSYLYFFRLQNCTPLQKKCTILELIFIFCSSKFVHKFAKRCTILEPYGFILFIIKINSKFVHKFLKKCTNLELSLCET